MKARGASYPRCACCPLFKGLRPTDGGFTLAGRARARQHAGVLAVNAKCCPHNHRSLWRSYPHVWMQCGLKTPKPLQRRDSSALPTELQRCKLPTVWITPVENRGGRLSRERTLKPLGGLKGPAVLGANEQIRPSNLRSAGPQVPARACPGGLSVRSRFLGGRLEGVWGGAC